MKKALSISICILFISICSAQVVPEITGSRISQQDAQNALDFHNKVRAEVGCPGLQWSSTLSAYAQEWADKLAKNCKIQHRPIGGIYGRKFGENIFWGGGKDFTGVDASEAWYGEIKQYKYSEINESNWQSTGHYTQMVWSGTTHVGFGVAKCRDGQTIIVANYDPPGNYLGIKPY